jgi:tetratricopeptide (TPR) repeat protein
MLPKIIFFLFTIFIGVLFAIFRYFAGFIVGMQGMIAGTITGLAAGNLLIFSKNNNNFIIFFLISLISLTIFYIGFFIGIGILLPEFLPFSWLQDLINNNSKEVLFGFKKRGSMIFMPDRGWWIFFNILDVLFQFAFTFVGIAISRPKKVPLLISLDNGIKFVTLTSFAILVIFFLLYYFNSKDIAKIYKFKSEDFKKNKNIEFSSQIKMLSGAGNLNDIEKAINLLNKKLIKEPSYYEFYAFRADFYVWQRKINDALNDYSQIIHLIEKNPKKTYIVMSISSQQLSKIYFKAYIHLCRAKLYLGLNDYENAIEDIYTAKNLIQNSRNIFFTKAFIHHKKGEFTEAIHEYNNALSIKPVHLSEIDFVNT